MLGIEGYEPEWHHDAEALAAVHRARFSRLIGRELVGGWLMWDMSERGWFADGPVILGFGNTHVEITHRNLNDGTVEGFECTDMPAFAVQHHPEAGPGPHDSRYLFERFAELMDGFAK